MMLPISGYQGEKSDICYPLLITRELKVLY